MVNTPLSHVSIYEHTWKKDNRINLLEPPCEGQEITIYGWKDLLSFNDVTSLKIK